jgi:hypothetical protein
MTHTEALTMALEALEEAWYHVGTFQPTEKAIDLYDKAKTAIKEALAQPKQEPVPTLEDIEQEIYENTRIFVSRDVMEWMLRRYYTHPPQRTWAGLTDKEMLSLYNEHIAAVGLIGVFRAIEAKLKDKNT